MFDSGEVVLGNFWAGSFSAKGGGEGYVPIQVGDVFVSLGEVEAEQEFEELKNEEHLP